MDRFNTGTRRILKPKRDEHDDVGLNNEEETNMNQPERTKLEARVFCLVTCFNPDLIESCTLNFATIKKAFPSCEISIHINNNSFCKKEIMDKAWKCGLDAMQSNKTFFHADYVSEIIDTNCSLILNPKQRPVIIVDGDTIFWENCEFAIDDLWGGFYVPCHHNDWSNSMSMSRLHPSFLIIPSCAKLKEALVKTYPRAYETFGEYCGFKPFHPVTVFNRGNPIFYDTCSVAYHTVSGFAFTPEHLACYDHLNSATFYDIMMDRITVPRQFKNAHILAKTKPELLRGLNEYVTQYYEDRRLDD